MSTLLLNFPLSTGYWVPTLSGSNSKRKLRGETFFVSVCFSVVFGRLERMDSLGTKYIEQAGTAE